MIESRLVNLKSIYDLDRLSEEDVMEYYYHISQMIKDVGRVVIYGAGSLGKMLAPYLDGLGLNVLAFTDSSEIKWGTFINGIEVVSPDKIVKKLGNDLVIIIAIFNPCTLSSKITYKDLFDNMNALGFERVFLFHQLIGLDNTLFPHYYLDAPSCIFKNKQNIYDFYNLLIDETSKKLLVDTVNWRLYYRPDDEPVINYGTQYFESNIYNLHEHEVFIDGGAFDGDTVREFLKRTDNMFMQIHAFEPDSLNYLKLRQFVDSLDDDISRGIKIYDIGLSDQNAKVAFDSGYGEGSSINRMDINKQTQSSSSQGFVEVKKLDDICFEQSPTFVKLDIEGYEKNAILGMKGILKSSPLLAICLYHRPNDFWELPLLIREINEDYKFSIRQYSLNGSELVCYGVPSSRM